ncbi:tail fiber domain-containing protein [Rasiella rasia]|uniref:Tail fiber domain-containing protein n=1 Tax=Rasiella rasia TaxID=2744027 RepID=A0A6G6GJU1_9FLAO|nr:tail fiber domain-containing protein [Rasiella rasia]QIE58784.1 tail fiber domain-containing protein [Rasiella rasia]
MKTSLTLFFVLIFFGKAFSQVGIGTTTPNAQLDISASNSATPSNTDGLLIPKIDEFPVTVPTSAQDGMLVFVTGNGTPTKGFYYWDQGTTSWIPFVGSGGASEWVDNGPDLSPVAGATKDVSVGGLNDTSARLTVRSDKSVGGLFTNSSTQDVAMYGLQTILQNDSTDPSSVTVANQNEITVTGVGTSVGEFNFIDGAGSGFKLGVINFMNGAGTGNQTSFSSFLDGAGQGDQTGIITDITNSGDAFHTGLINTMGGSGSGAHVGVTNSLYGTGTGSQFAIENRITNSGDGNHIGQKTFINNSGNGFHMGVDNQLLGAGDGGKTGANNFVDSSGSGNHIGTNNWVASSGSGNHIGSYNFLNGAGSGDKYGIQSLLLPTAGGQHYGVWSSALKTGAYAGYFLGDVAIGTTAGNLYTLPPSRGTAGQVMQTDGAGNVSWAAPGGGADADWLEQGTGLPADAITDNIYTNGEVVIGGNLSTGGKLEVFDDSELRAIHVRKFGNYPSTFSAIGVLAQVSATGTDYNVGFHASMSTAGTNSPQYGYWATLEGTGLGEQIAYSATINTDNNYDHVGLRLLLQGGGGTHFGSKITLGGSSGQNGNQTVIHNEIINQGNGIHKGVVTSIIGHGTGLHVGLDTDLTGNGSGDKIGNDVYIAGNGDGNRFGNKVEILAVGNGPLIGTQNEITGSNFNTKTGTKNIITATGEAIHIGTDNQLSGNATGPQYGTQTNISIAAANNASHYGAYTDVSSMGSGVHFGNYINLGNAGSGNQLGTYIGVNNSGNGTHYGTQTILSGSGTGLKYGSHILLPPSAGGTHYGLYSEALKTGSYAGYFLGNLAVGTTTANTYTLPASRGTNGQIMQTDGAGVVSWTTLSLPSFSDIDGDTQIQVEEVGDEDKIRFDTNGVERMIIDANGVVGINTTTPGDELHVKGDIRIEASADTDFWFTRVDLANDYNFFYNGTLKSYVQDTDGSYNIFSDRRLKKDVAPISTTISEKVLQLKPVNYSYISDETNRLQHGFIAQEVQQLFPELVNEKETENGTFLSLNYQAFGVLAIKTIQEQQKEIDTLKAEISELRKLEDRIAKLEMN